MFENIKLMLGGGKKKGADIESAGSWEALGAIQGIGISPQSLLSNDKNWVYVCVDKIAEAGAGIPLKLMKFNKGGDDEEVFDHTILDVLNKPNRFMTGRDLFYLLFAHQELTGNAFILHEQEKNPKELLPISPAQIKVKLRKDQLGVSGYDHRVGSFHDTYTPEQVVHLKYPNPMDPFRGRGTLSQIAEWVDVDNYATEFNRRFFINGSVVGGTLETEATTKEALQLAKLGWDMKHQGVANAHKTSVLPKGVKFTDTAKSPRDMEFNEMDKRFRDKILAGFGVPKSVLGVVEDVNRSNAEASNYVFMAFTVKPKMDRLVSYLNEYLLPLYDKTESLYIAYNDPTPENREIVINERKAALGGAAYMTPNEVRAEEGLPPADGGDELKTSSNFGVISTDPEKAIKKGIKRIPHRAKAKAKTEEASKGIVEAAIAAVNEVTKSDPAEVAEQLHKEFIVRVTTYEEKLVENFKDHDHDLHREVVAGLQEITKDFKDQTKEVSLVERVVDRKKEEKIIFDFTEPLLFELMKREGAEQMARLDVPGTAFDPHDEKMRAKLVHTVELMSEKYTDTTIDLLNDTLKKGIKSGNTMEELEQRVAKVFDMTDSFRANRVARTTTFSVANAAAREAYKQSGVVKTVVWHTAEDEMVCEFCGPMNDKTIDIDDQFFAKGSEIEGADGGMLSIDYDDVADPPLHANCRCFTNAGEIDIGEASAEQVAETKQEEDPETAFLSEGIKILEKYGEQK